MTTSLNTGVVPNIGQPERCILARRHAELDQTQLGERLGSSRRTVSRIETTHTLRHRFASAAYRADRDIRAVQELLGHASVATTQIYTAVPDDAVRRAAGVAAVRAVA